MINSYYDYNELPTVLNNFDSKKFGQFNLFEYQEKAIINTSYALIDYYCVENNLKKYLIQISDKIKDELSIKLDKNTISFYSNHYKQSEFKEIETLDKKKSIFTKTLPFESLLNRLSYWMATGSGKTYVMVKLLELLFLLAKNKLIPENKIMLLAPTDDILNQIINSIKIFNENSQIKITIKSLKEYDPKSITYSYSNNELIIYLYKSNNLKLEGFSKDKELCYTDFIQEEINGIKYGNWFIFLDEAHKGTKEGDSSLQNIYNFLSNGSGFLFNFSATFTDKIDKISTISNFNLSEYIKNGYGKQVKVLESEFKNLKGKEEISKESKEKIILQSWIIFSIIKESKIQLNAFQENLYHNPLMMVITNTVNTIEADMKIYFQLMLDLNKNNISKIFNEAKKNIEDEFSNDDFNRYQFTNKNINSIFLTELQNTTIETVRKNIFNSDTYSEIEVIEVNDKEIAFKLKNTTLPFALLNIGDVSSWIKELSAKPYEFTISKDKINTNYFSTINNIDSNINILMGKNIFSEGWDSNRPNIINFINIGVGKAEKFLLQSIGRGIRIEPTKGFRQRIEKKSDFIHNKIHLQKIKNLAEMLESLFLISTDKNIINGLLQNIQNENCNILKNGFDFKDILNINENELAQKNNLYIPKYKKNDNLQHNKYNLHTDELSNIRKEIKNNYENVLFINGIKPNTLLKIAEDENFSSSKEKKGISSKKLLRILNSFFNIKDYDAELVSLQDEIKHHKFIEIETKETQIISQVKQKITDLINGKVEYDSILEIQNAIELGKENLSELSNLVNKLNNNKLSKINIKSLSNHYYLPVILNQNKEIYIKNVISEESEINFILELEDELNKKNNCFNKYEFWCFSKLVQNTDDIFIPYNNQFSNTENKFYPDFIFWLKEKDKPLKIMFIDPKGLKQGQEETRMKVLGFEKLQLKINKNFNDIDIRLILFNKTMTTDKILEKYRFGSINSIF